MNISKSPNIRIIDSIDSAQIISSAEILSTLEATAEKLGHGDTFTGKPGTQIFSSDQFVVKLHTELSFSERDSERWIEKKLADERSFTIYTPEKTWFILLSAEKPVIANITPLLTPLHQIEEHSNSMANIDYLKLMFAMYFRIGATFQELLDGGLSNFGLDKSNNLYYLDDDIYKWDKFTSFCSLIGVLIRQLSNTSVEQWTDLGDFCKTSILENFNDKHQLVVAFEQLRGAFMVNDQQKRALSAFTDGFYQLRSVKRLFKTGIDQERRKDHTKIAILADVHANLPALDAVLAELSKQNITEGIILGDIVGYGPHPAECIEKLRQTNFTVIKGNHDHAIATGKFTGGFSASGRFVAEWSSERIDDEGKKWLDELPPYISHQNWLAVHGSPVDKTFFNGYVYKMTSGDNLDNLQQREIPVCFHGHSHVQGVFMRKKNQDDFSSETVQDLSSYEYSLVCPGSIGQPRSNVSGAEFAIYDTESMEINFYRIDYDIEKTMADMTKLNFPSYLIERLPLGK